MRFRRTQTVPALTLRGLERVPAVIYVYEKDDRTFHRFTAGQQESSPTRNRYGGDFAGRYWDGFRDGLQEGELRALPPAVQWAITGRNTA